MELASLQSQRQSCKTSSKLHGWSQNETDTNGNNYYDWSNLALSCQKNVIKEFNNH